MLAHPIYLFGDDHVCVNGSRWCCRWFWWGIEPERG